LYAFQGASLLSDSNHSIARYKTPSIVRCAVRNPLLDDHEHKDERRPHYMISPESAGSRSDLTVLKRVLLPRVTRAHLNQNANILRVHKYPTELSERLGVSVAWNEQKKSARLIQFQACVQQLAVAYISYLALLISLLLHG